MHPEVRQEKPGRCPTCGMALVLETLANQRPKPEDTGLGPITWRSYLPLLVIVLLITAASLVGPAQAYLHTGLFPLENFIVNFMAGFFLVFGGFKLMDLKGFADGYSTYDLLAQRFFAYGYIYPFIELKFGFLMLAGYHPDWLLWTEFGVMLFSGLGVGIKLARREPFLCACLGTFLKVPLTYVSLIENLGMAALALFLAAK